MLQWGRRRTAAERSPQGNRADRTAARFNGAAAEQRRRDRRNGNAKHAILSFNGAAAEQRRRATGQDGAATAFVPLQWGRRRTAAESGVRAARTVRTVPASMGPPQNSGGETSNIVAPQQTITQLQWGRRRTAAESSASGNRLHMIHLLQWGRRRTAAESSTWRARTPSSRGFNGAAAEQRRRESEPFADIADPCASMGPPQNSGGELSDDVLGNRFGWLQWGRRRTAAERAARVEWLSADDGASMGPPQNSGGEPITEMVVRAVGDLLQWGRRRTAAESLSHGPRKRTAPIASMGPPQNGGGE